jgi:hypothetical protein
LARKPITLKKPINVVLNTNISSLGNLSIQCGMIYNKSIIYLNWKYYYNLPISNYTSSKADLNKPEYKFAKFLLNEGVKIFRIQVPSIEVFS